jgi:hypothetical protein
MDGFGAGEDMKVTVYALHFFVTRRLATGAKPPLISKHMATDFTAEASFLPPSSPAHHRSPT